MNDTQNSSNVLSEDNKKLEHPPFLIIASTITQTQMNLSVFRCSLAINRAHWLTRVKQKQSKNCLIFFIH